MQTSQGLTSEQVWKRKAQGKVNVVTPTQSKSYADIIKSNVFTFFNLIHVILFLFVVAVGEFKNGIFILIIVANTVIGIVQEMRAKHKVDKLKILTAPHVDVIRDAKRCSVEVSELVQDDVVLFAQGSQICADAVVLDGYVEANEALVTGESETVKKQVGDTLLSGSFVSSGQCFAKLTQVGDHSYAAKLAAEAKKHKKINSELLNSLNKIIKTVGYVLIPMGILLLVKQYATIAGEGAFSTFQFSSFSVAVTKTVAALTGMIPEGLYLLTSVALAVSMIRLVQQKALVQEMYAIESLARVDVLCIDKTGTITSGRMHVQTVENLTDEDIASRMMPSILAALDDHSVTAEALSKYFGQSKRYQVVRVVPFSSARKWSGCAFSDSKYVFGAAEFILSEIPDELSQRIQTYAAQGCRVLLFARCEQMDEQHISNAEPLALFIIEDEIRAHAKRTFRFFRQNDVAIKVISGDNPVTVSAIASRVGIPQPDRYIDLSTVGSNVSYAELAEKYTVFGRVRPDQKRKLVQALKKQGHTVGMTGDGVNDVLALKDADCSIAMASGSDAAAKVANIVLTDSDFASIPDCVFEGRRVINNIQRSGALFLVKTIFSFALSVLTILLPLSYPFISIHLTLLSAITIGIPGFFLALQPDRHRVRGRFIENILQNAIPSAVSNVCCLLTLMIIEQIAGLTNPNILGTAALLISGFVGFVTLFRICLPFDKIRKIIFGGCAALFVLILLLAATVFSGFFELAVLPWWLTLTVVLLMLISIPLTWRTGQLVRRIFQRRQNPKPKKKRGRA